MPYDKARTGTSELLWFGFESSNLADRLNFYREPYFGESIFASTLVELSVVGASSRALA